MDANNDAPFVISRRDARERGFIWYFEKPCFAGHTAKRLVSGKHCSECHRLRQIRTRQANPSAVKATKAASYQRNRAKVIAAVEAYTVANREKVRERRRKHREANKETIALRMKVWCKANRPILRQHERNRRAREAGAEGRHTAADIEAILKLQKGRCANPVCRKSIRRGYHVDHVQPLALGGTNWPRNLQLLCQTCNQAKHALHPIEWAQGNGLLI